MIRISSEKCNSCGNCFEVCPSIVIGEKDIDSKKEFFVRHPEQCAACGHCMAACAPRAISHPLLSYEDFEKLDEIDITPESMKNLLLSRRSVRKYKADPAPQGLVDELIEVATCAGTGSNLQSVNFVEITDKELLKQLEHKATDIIWNSGLKLLDRKWLLPAIRLRYGAEATEQLLRYHDSMKHRRDNNELEGMVFRNAPLVILAHDVKQNRMGRINCAIAMRNIETMALTMGLGTCWAGYFISAAGTKPAEINGLLGLDDSRRIWGALMVGYPRFKSTYKIPRKKREVKKF